MCGKSLPRAGWIETAEAAHLHTQRHRPTLRRQIAKPPLVMTVDALGSLCTARAVWRLLTGAGHHGNLVGARQDLVDHQACWDQRQDTFRQGRLSKRLGVLPFDYPLLKRRVDSTQSAGDPDIHCHSYHALTNADRSRAP